jgi:hypothetical protein
MSSNYKVAVDIVLANGVSPVLAVISRDVLGVNSTVKQIENSFGRWTLAVGGVAAILGGTAILGALSKIADKGQELVHQQELMKIAGLDNQAIAQATAKAYEVSAKVQTSTISENLKHLRELRYAFGSMDVANASIFDVTKANTVLNSVRGGGKDEVWELVKSLEQKGITTNAAEFKSYVDTMTQAVIATGGRVTPQMFQSAFKYGRTAMLGWDQEFITQILPRDIQAMATGGGGGGSGTGGPGNALMTAFQHIIGGQMSRQSAYVLNSLGLIDPTKIVHSKSGEISRVMPGGVKGSDLFGRNPYEWVQQVLAPAVIARAGHDESKILEILGQAFRARTEGQKITEYLLQGRTFLGADSPYEKDRALTLQAMKNAPAFAQLAGNDPLTITKAFHSQWEAMFESIGSAITPSKLEVMKSLTDVFTAVGQFAGAHPEGIKIAAEALAIIAGSLVVGGLVALGAAIAPLVGVAGGIAAAATALGALVVLNWDSIKNGAATLWADLKNTAHMIFDPLVEVISSIFAKISNAIKWGLSWIPGIGSANGTISGGAKGAFDGATTPSGVPKVLPQSFQGPAGEGGALLHRANWSPPQKTAQPVNVASQINLDGRLLAEAVADKLAEMLEHPTSAPFFDPRRAWSSPDAQVSTT